MIFTLMTLKLLKKSSKVKGYDTVLRSRQRTTVNIDTCGLRAMVWLIAVVLEGSRICKHIEAVLEESGSRKEMQVNRDGSRGQAMVPKIS